MEQERKNFIYGKKDENGNIEIEGCIRRGVSEKIAQEIFDDMIDFAKYAFNKSHAAGYAMIAYQTAYLKTKFPKEFMAALMTSVMGNQDKLAIYIRDCRRMGINVLPPSVNSSYEKFSVVSDGIRFGLSAVKNVGKGIIKAIVNNRNNGQYIDFVDFCDRVGASQLNKKSVESLIKAGAFDDMKIYRSRLLAVYEKIIEGVQRESKNNVEGQISLFPSSTLSDGYKLFDEDFPQITELKTNIKLAFEKEMLGIYITGHPLSEFKDVIKSMSTSHIIRLYEAKEEGEIEQFDNRYVRFAGLIIKINEKITRNGKRMAFIQFEDLTSQVEAIVFPKIYTKYASIIERDKPILLSGKISIKEDEKPQIIVDKIQKLTMDNAISDKKDKTLYLKIPSLDSVITDGIKKILGKYKGNNPVVLYAFEQKKAFKTSKNLWVHLSEKLLEELYELLGKENVVLK